MAGKPKFAHRRSVSRQPVRSTRVPRFETLERRLLLATDIWVNDNWFFLADRGQPGVLDSGDLVVNLADPVNAGQVVATYGIDAFGTVAAGTLSGAAPEFDEIRDAIDAVEVDPASQLATVHVLPGTYDTSTPDGQPGLIITKAGLQLLGAGSDITRVQASREAHGGVGILVSASRVTVAGLDIRGHPPEPVISVSAGHTTVAIQANMIQGGGTGVELLASEGRIESNEIFHNGIGVWQNGGANNIVSNNLVYDSLGSGIVIHDDAGVPEFNQVTGNQVHGNAGHGIVVSGNANLVQSNVIQANGIAGLRLARSQGTLIVANHICGNGTLGDPQPEPRIDAAAAGILFSDRGVVGADITGNRISSNLGSGIYVEDALGATFGNVVRGNDIEGNLLRAVTELQRRAELPPGEVAIAAPDNWWGTDDARIVEDYLILGNVAFPDVEFGRTTALEHPQCDPIQRSGQSGSWGMGVAPGGRGPEDGLFRWGLQAPARADEADRILQKWYWFRAEGDPAERPLNSLPLRSLDSNGNRIELQYRGERAGRSPIEATLVYELSGPNPNASTIVETVTLRNLTAAGDEPVEVHLQWFEFTDLDLDRAYGGDRAEHPNRFVFRSAVGTVWSTPRPAIASTTHRPRRLRTRLSSLREPRMWFTRGSGNYGWGRRGAWMTG